MALTELAAVSCFWSAARAWHWAPIIPLAAFLGFSVLHFGVEDARSDLLAIAAGGGLPVALPVLLHPAATSAVFGEPMMQPPFWLMASAGSWAGFSPFWVWHRWHQP